MLDFLRQPDILRHALPISVACYEKMAELGLVDERTELIRGVIFEKMSKSPLHSGLTRVFVKALGTVLPQGYFVSTEQPLHLRDSCPEPDIAVVRGTEEDFLRQHPESALFLIEIAVSSEMIDREKASVYAEAGVEEYWIVLPERRSIERFTLPSADGFGRHEVFSAGETVFSLTVGGFGVNLAQLLDPA